MKLTTKTRKKFRVSNKVKKVSAKDRFRLSISRSSRNISAQIIDDIKNITLLSASSIEKDVKS
jgi:large subunit ribosomal protein L18